MRKIIGVLVGLALMSTLAACGGSEDDETYRPVAFGENGKCYYLQDEEEADAMVADGSCDQSWVAAPMPPYWLYMYAPYYHSPAYYERYVPASRRNTFIARTNAWEKNANNMKQVEGARTRATWVNSKGTQVVGSRINYTKAGFGSGSVRSSGFSSGVRCAPVRWIGPGKPLLAQRSGGGGSRSGGGFSSGGSRSGGSGSRSGGSSSGGVSKPGSRPGSGSKPSVC